MSNSELSEVKIDYENGEIISIIHKWRDEPCEMSDEEFKQKLNVLYNQLLEKVPSSIKAEDKIDYVNQFLSILITPHPKKDGTLVFYTPSIIEVNSLQKVASLMRKKMMKNNEPTKYEINTIVRAALRSLVKEGKICRHNKRKDRRT